MSKGYPDFFGQSIFPSYGSLILTRKTWVLYNLGDSYTFLDLTGQGVLRSLSFSYGFRVKYLNTLIHITLDDNDPYTVYVRSPQDFPLDKNTFPYLEHTFYTLPIWGCNISGDVNLPFYSRCKVECENEDGNSLTIVYYSCHYMLI